MKVEITKYQIRMIKEAANNLEAMIGCGDSDTEWQRIIKAIDRFLKKNNLER
jgi:hypothetical protein